MKLKEVFQELQELSFERSCCWTERHCMRNGDVFGHISMLKKHETESTHLLYQESRKKTVGNRSPFPSPTTKGGSVVWNLFWAWSLLHHGRSQGKFSNFLRVALLQHVFTELMPLPLGPLAEKAPLNLTAAWQDLTNLWDEMCMNWCTISVMNNKNMVVSGAGVMLAGMSHGFSVTLVQQKRTWNSKSLISASWMLEWLGQDPVWAPNGFDKLHPQLTRGGQLELLQARGMVGWDEALAKAFGNFVSILVGSWHDVQMLQLNSLKIASPDSSHHVFAGSFATLWTFCVCELWSTCFRLEFPARTWIQVYWYLKNQRLQIWRTQTNTYRYTFSSSVIQAQANVSGVLW